ncbi:LysR family transcriptional regulator [Paracoccus caeni]|uniref:LysR family transcriptional regulator n=1 Tax=Paracoccus caeni TaxID=657651 RepID=A0A934SG55_9RHOB|nr:LysR substrate-binding domain-containing protein [Paracoccus caeni]MBK4216401.1 LysR family transcriptional regulator [Paracoccus caeni]
MVTLQQLRYLVAVADTLNFSRAAELCHVTQPTLSMQIKELEERLSARLIERTRARVLLTPVGQEIARRARAIMAEMDDIREIARRDDPNATQAILHMGVVKTVGAYVLAVAMPSLRRSFPDLRLFVHEDPTDALIRQLSDGARDALLLPEALHRNDLESRHLMNEPLLMVLPADHELARQDSISPEDLSGQTILGMEGGRYLNTQIDRLCRDVGAIHARDYEGTTLDTLRQMVAAGMGLSLLPALYVRSEVLREQQVTARPLAARAPVRPISLVWRKGAPRSRTYSALAENLRDCLAEWSVERR